MTQTLAERLRETIPRKMRMGPGLESTYQAAVAVMEEAAQRIEQLESSASSGVTEEMVEAAWAINVRDYPYFGRDTTHDMIQAAFTVFVGVKCPHCAAGNERFLNYETKPRGFVHVIESGRVACLDQSLAPTTPPQGIADELAEVIRDMMPYARATIGAPESSWQSDNVILRARTALLKHDQMKTGGKS